MLQFEMNCAYFWQQKPFDSSLHVILRPYNHTTHTQFTKWKYSKLYCMRLKVEKNWVTFHFFTKFCKEPNNKWQKSLFRLLSTARNIQHEDEMGLKAVSSFFFASLFKLVKWLYNHSRKITVRISDKRMLFEKCTNIQYEYPII